MVHSFLGVPQKCTHYPYAAASPTRVLRSGNPYPLIDTKQKCIKCAKTMKTREEKKDMRKYKQVKEKKVTYELDEWEEVERRARKLKMKTGTYIKRISVDGKVEYCDVGELAPLVKEVNAIGVNVNQLARKANELNSIYAGDMEKMKELIETLCRMLSSFACTRQWSRV